MTVPVISAINTSNTEGEKIAMTAPVMTDKEGEAWRYRVVLPDKYSLDTAPRPLNPDVSIVETLPQRVAVLRYSGRATAKAQREKAQTLTNWIESEGLQALSEPRWAGCNAPWTLPLFRRYEVLIDVTAR